MKFTTYLEIALTIFCWAACWMLGRRIAQLRAEWAKIKRARREVEAREDRLLAAVTLLPLAGLFQKLLSDREWKEKLPQLSKLAEQGKSDEWPDVIGGNE